MHKVVDSHVHFWDNNKARIDWIKEIPALNQAFYPADLFDEAGDIVVIDRLVFVQADVLPEDSLREVQWVTELAQEHPQIQGIVAHAPLENLHDAENMLNALSHFPHVKGVRRLIQSEKAGFSKQKSFIQSVKLLSPYDYSFDICIYHHQLPDVLHLVEQCPEITFVLDHIGKPNIRRGVVDLWKEHIAELAQHDHVWCKLSGLVTEADHHNWSPEDLRPYVDHVIDSFGASRLMFGGDWPVVRLASTYGRWVETLQSLLADLHEDDLKKIYYDNAISVYNL